MEADNAGNAMTIPKLATINPCKGVELPRPDDEEIHPLTPAEVNIPLRAHALRAQQSQWWSQP